MTVALYMDVHIPRAITAELRRRGVNVLTAQEDGTDTLADPLLLDRATALKRVMVSSDSHFLAEATRRQQNNVYFAGIVRIPDRGVSLGQRITDLELFAKASDLGDTVNTIAYLPY